MEPISYLTHCLKNDKLIRWPDTCMPLTFYVAPFRWYKERNNSYKYHQMVFNALDFWQKASNGKVRFKLVNNMNESMINLDWRRVDRSSLGHCQFYIDNLGRLYSAEIQIGLSDGLIHSQYQNENEVMHTIIHEIGHSIGLNHSPYKNDIMYVPHQYGVVNISNRDVLTLKWLYSFPYGSSRKEILSKYKMTSESDLDSLILKLENKDIPESEFEESMKEISQKNIKDLDEDHQLLAKINKYNLSLQNINISNDLQEYIKKTIIEKKMDNKKR